MGLDGTGKRRLVSVSLGTSSGASFAPDGKSIVYSRKAGDEGANLWVADRSGGSERPITPGEDTYDGSPAFSPDGRWIACYAAGDSASALVVMATDGSQPRTRLEAGHNWFPRWSPDGCWLVCTAAVDAAMTDIDVFAIPVAGARAPAARERPRPGTGSKLAATLGTEPPRRATRGLARFLRPDLELRPSQFLTPAGPEDFYSSGSAGQRTQRDARGVVQASRTHGRTR